MIYGIGVDITKVSRFEKWCQNPEIISRFFNKEEICFSKEQDSLCQYYAARFAAKEAFSKALGTGIKNFSLKDLYIKNNKDGKPELFFSDSVKQILQNRCGECVVHVSLSHETDYAIAYVVIEKI